MLHKRGRKPGTESAKRDLSTRASTFMMVGHILKIRADNCHQLHCFWRFTQTHSQGLQARQKLLVLQHKEIDKQKYTSVHCSRAGILWWLFFISVLSSAQQAGKYAQLWEVLLPSSMLGVSQSKLPLQTCSLLLNNNGFDTVLWRKGNMFNSTRHTGQHLKTFLLFASKFEFEINKNHLGLVF